MRFSFLILLFLAGCATSPEALKEQPVDFEYSQKSADLLTLSECILYKIEAYPILVGLSFEQRTLPVQIRQFSDNAEMYQMQGALIATLVQLKKSDSKIDASLRVADQLLSHERTVKAYSQYIQECY